MAGALILSALFLFGLRWLPPVTEWTMVNVNDTPAQADAHLIRAGKHVVLIDAGTEESADRVLVPFLRDLGIEEIDRLYITHPHKDHYGGIHALLDTGITVRRASFFMPYKSQCDEEIPWGCDHIHVRGVLERLYRSGSILETSRAGQILHLSPDASLKVLHAYDGVVTPVGRTDVNDLSLIMRLEHGPTSVLFTGDLNNLLGSYLATQGDEIKATILKVPHHGAESVAPNSFYAAVSPEQALVPSSALLWCSERSARTRDWLASHQIPTHVNGLHGHVSVLMQRSGYSVRREVANQVLACEDLS